MGESVELEGSKWMKEAVCQNLTWMDFKGKGLDTDIPDWLGDVTADDTTRMSQVTQNFKTSIGLHELQKTNTLCDITIKVQERSFQAHRVVLAAGSEYFTLMFTKGFQETCEPELTLKDGNSEAFDVLLNFMYCGELNLSSENVTNVIKMAHYLQMDVAMKRCEHFIDDILKSTTGMKLVMSIFSVVEMFNLLEVKNKCERYLARNFKPTDEFLKYITLEKMEVVLKRLDLKDEKQVFDTTVAWLQHDWDGRKDCAPQLFAMIRLGAVPVGHLSMTVFKSPALYAIPECCERIERVMMLTDSAKPGDAPLHSLDYNLFATRTTQDGIVCINSSMSNNERAASFYDQRDKTWTILPKFPKLPEKYNNTNDTYECFTMKGNLYIVRGIRDASNRAYKCPRFLRLDTQHKKLLTLATMTEGGRNPRDATYIPIPTRNQIVVIGGNNRSPCKVEMYDVEQNEWHKSNESWQPDRYIYKPMTGVVHTGNILVYVQRRSEAGSEVTTHDLYRYTLHPERPCMTACKRMMTEDHPASEFTGLVMNEGKCYRVAGGSCRCTTEGCQWHKVFVNELVINANTGTATVGNAQDQSVIPESYRKSKAFRINSDVYVILWKKFFKVERVTGSVGSESVSLGNWSKMFRMGFPESHSFTAMMAFDPVAWQN